MTNLPSHLHRSAALGPAMPRHAALAGRELARPVKAIDQALRAVAAWFAQQGDPFLPMDGPTFQAALRDLAAREASVDHLSTAELLVRLRAAHESLQTRLDAAAREE